MAIERRYLETNVSSFFARGSNKPDVILVNCIIVIVSLLLLATVMLVIMTRKKRTGKSRGL